MFAKNAKQHCTSQYRDTLRGIRVRLCGKGALDSKLCMTLMELQGKLPASNRGCNKLGKHLAEQMIDEAKQAATKHLKMKVIKEKKAKAKKAAEAAKKLAAAKALAVKRRIAAKFSDPLHGHM